MKGTVLLSSCLPIFALAGLAVITGCSDPTGFSSTNAANTAASGAATPTEPEQCAASEEWLPADGGAPSPQQMFEPIPHPNSECPFYRGGWQNFLMATHEDANGEPAIASMATIDDAFTFTKVNKSVLAPPGQHRGTAQRAWLGVVKQAGFRKLLIDHDNHTLYYGIHINQQFIDFVNANGLQTAQGIQAAPQNLFFPAGVVELKSAWKNIDMQDGISSADNANYKANYVWTKAYLPTLSMDPTSNLLTEDDNTTLAGGPREVALVALHVVFTLPGHPEFIWTSFEHVDVNGANLITHGVGAPDSAPTFDQLPDPVNDPDNARQKAVVSPNNFLFYTGGTPANQALQFPAADTGLGFHPDTQKFDAITNVYRMFPGSKSNDINPDDAVAALNGNMAALFASNAPNDVRSHYRLVGGQWLDKPEFFVVDSDLQNDSTSPILALSTDATSETSNFANVSQDDERLAFFNDPNTLKNHLTPQDDLNANGSDSPFSIIAGEDRMSSTSMETFTQGGDSFHNCFTCHNSQAVTANGIPFDRDQGVPSMPTPKLLQPGLINVSHVFTEVVVTECGTTGMCPAK